MSLVCDVPWGKGIYKLQTISIRFPGCGYYLRWYYNGWHYWFFLPGKTVFQTEGEKYRTIGTRKVSMGSGQITSGECAAIRTIMNTKEVYIYTDSGWKNLRIEPGTLIVYDNQISGYEIEFAAIIGSRAISSITGYTPIQNIPLVPPTPDPTICEVTIGTQIWMCKNYDIDFPGSKVYNDDEANRSIYGGLYTWDQIMASGFCPTGWHIPSIAEWDVLMVYLGGGAISGGKLKEIGTSHWTTPNTGATDDYLFTNLPGGYYVGHVLGYPLINTFDGIGLLSRLWVSDEDGLNAYNVLSVYDDAGLTYELLDKSFYFSVRIIKDTPAPLYSDWFLGSLNENVEMYNELHLYSLGGFSNAIYWTSSEINNSNGYYIDFNSGMQNGDNKYNTHYVRAIRAFTSVSPSYSVRDIGPAGGLIFWKNGNDYLESAPTDQSVGKLWSNIDSLLIGTTDTAIGTGQANTTAIITQVGHTNSAAKLCDDLIL